MEKIIGTIEVRMGSTRFPGKSLRPILNKPMLQVLIERVQRSKRIREIVIATTENPNNDPIEQLAKTLGIACYRGSENDVLDRVYQAATAHGGDVLVELWGDNPLMDPAIIDDAVDFFLSRGVDCTGTTLNKTYPYGLSCLVFRCKTLEEVWRITQDPADRENVSNYIYEHPEKYRTEVLPCPAELNRPDIRLTVDTEADFNLVKAVHGALYPHRPNFTAKEIIEWLDQHPEVKEINSGIRQKTLDDCRQEYARGKKA